MERKRIAVVGAGYVGLSLAVLLSQLNDVTIVEKQKLRADMINERRSPIRDSWLEKYLAEKELSLRVVLPEQMDYARTDLAVIATPTDYDPASGTFDTRSIEETVQQIRKQNPQACVVIKSTVPIGYTAKLKEETGLENVLFSPEFLRESKALYDMLYPSRIVVGYDLKDGASRESADAFAGIHVAPRITVLFLHKYRTLFAFLQGI